MKRDTISLQLFKRPGLNDERLAVLRGMTGFVDNADIEAEAAQFDGHGHAAGSGSNDENERCLHSVPPHKDWMLNEALSVFGVPRPFLP